MLDFKEDSRPSVLSQDDAHQQGISNVAAQSSFRLADLMDDPRGGSGANGDKNSYDQSRNSSTKQSEEGEQGTNTTGSSNLEEGDADDELSDAGYSVASPSDSNSYGTTATSSGGTTGQSIEERDGKSRRECCLSYLRFFLFWSVFGSVIFVGMEVVRYASQRDDDFLGEEFFEFASDLILTAQNRHRAILDALQTMSLTTLAMSTGQKWPFVVLPDFDLWTNRFSIGARAVTLVILAEGKDKKAWLDFSQQNYSSWSSSPDPLQEIIPYVWRNTNSSNGPSLPGLSLSIERDNIVEDDWSGHVAISWQSTTPIDPKAVNFNYLSSRSHVSDVQRMNATKEATHWSTSDLPSSSFLMQPILPKDSNEMFGYLMAQIPWMSYLSDVGVAGIPGIVLLLKDECRGHAVEVDLYLGRQSRLVNPDRFNDLVLRNELHLQAFLDPKTFVHNDACSSPFILHVFGTNDFVGVDGYVAARMNPPKLAIFVGLFVILMGTICFFLYDCLARRQQAKVALAAKRSLAIVNALFPATVRDRLLEKEDTTQYPPSNSIPLKHGSTHKTGNSNRKIQNRISTVFQSMAESIALGHDSTSEDVSDSGLPMTRTNTRNTIRRRMASKPIADLFPEVTVLFADIAGFTAWSSVREPSQVFTLLESIFECFDAIAKRHKIFKVETIGDCYVAASGLPDPCADHPIVMCTFARKALQRMGGVLRDLETYLGPGTSDLSMRIGIHSGPIMGGVLRGEKTRFQLFGDTMNTAARIESSGEKDRIHLSQQTAELLIQAGKEDWVEARDTLVTAKGKGELQTYWLIMGNKAGGLSGNASQASSTGMALAGTNKPTSMPNLIASIPILRRQESMPVVPDGRNAPSDKASVHLVQSSSSTKDQSERLIDYNTQVLERYLKKMVAMRQEKPTYVAPVVVKDGSKLTPTGISTARSVFDEVQESIELPTEPAKYLQNPDRVVLSPLVKCQLREYVGAIASLYRDVPFHCFDHASHVVMSVTKLMARVVTPEAIDYKDMRYKIKAGSTALHEYTYGITSDPLTQFTVAFAALIHDVDHTGLPNAQLVKEHCELAIKYDEKSVAEQHSINLAWNLLMEDKFNELRGCIYTSQAELDRFRALLVNATMATDIADKSLSELRRRRWAKVFGDEELDATVAGDQESMNRKATIVIEHLIQASDVAHTMQHWHVYLRWNKRLFKECYLAYHSGRADKNPLDSWYQGELGFYDHYIIPLAKKLKECGVFGVASDEYLHNATQNRSEWAAKGQMIVNDYREEFVASLGVTTINQGDPPQASPPLAGRGKKAIKLPLPSSKVFPSWRKH